MLYYDALLYQIYYKNKCFHKFHVIKFVIRHYLKMSMKTNKKLNFFYVVVINHNLFQFNINVVYSASPYNIIQTIFKHQRR